MKRRAAELARSPSQRRTAELSTKTRCEAYEELGEETRAEEPSRGEARTRGARQKVMGDGVSGEGRTDAQMGETREPEAERCSILLPRPGG